MKKSKRYNSKIRVDFKVSCLKQNVVHLFIVDKLDTWSQDLNAHFPPKDCFFGAVKLTKNDDPDRYSYSGYCIGFSSYSLFSLPSIYWGNNAIIFGADNSSSVHIDDKIKRDLNFTISIASINFTRSKSKPCLSLHENGSNSFSFVNAT